MMSDYELGTYVWAVVSAAAILAPLAALAVHNTVGVWFGRHADDAPAPLSAPSEPMSVC